jgi:NADH-quinone oxidoreductase subunit M
MNVSLILILLVGAFALISLVTKAPKLALFFGISALGCSIILLKSF